MGIEDSLQPTPNQGPNIRKVPHLPEMPGGIPPRPEQYPDLDEPEIEEKGDPTTRKAPDEPTPEIPEDGEPDLDTPEERNIKEIIKKIKKDPDKKEEPEVPKKDKDDNTLH